MTKLLSAEDVLLLLRYGAEGAGGLKGWARQTGLDRTHLSKCLHGHRPLNRKIIRALGLTEVVSYETNPSNTSGNAARTPKRPLNETLVVRLLEAEVKRAGSQSEWARRNGVHRTVVNKVLAGERPPTPKLLKALNLRRVLRARRSD